MKKNPSALSPPAAGWPNFMRSCSRGFWRYGRHLCIQSGGGHHPKPAECDLYLNTSTSYDLIAQQLKRSYFPPSYWVVQSAITFTKRRVEILQSYPEGTHAMLVNQSQHMAMESISQLYHLGISNIEFFPYSPEMDSVPDVDLAFAPGEADLAPPGVTVVDLGSRHLTANTICEIALKLGNPFS